MEKICDQCKTTFKARRMARRFCGTKCSAFWRHAHFTLPSSCFKKGVSTWNKGTNQSGMKGKKHSVLTKAKMRNAVLGEKSYRWKGKTEENYRIRRSAIYANWRKQVFERDNYTCVNCRERCRKGHKILLEADHIKPFALHPNLRFEVSNGRTLCNICHRKTDTWGVKNGRQA